MAVSVPGNAASIGTAGDIDGESDYGSDFSAGEEQLVDEILAELVSDTAAARTTRRSSPPPTTITTATTGRSLGGRDDAPSPALSSDASPSTASVMPTGLARPLDDNETASLSRREQHTVPLDSVGYPDLSQALSSLKSETRAAEQPPPAVEGGPDTRTPLQRFRSFPRRPLTVTDLAAGAWCELQHWYTLTRLPGGRKTITAAMRGGSRVHQRLEDEVHSAVQVSVASKEEAFALRLWNVIQGLRTLRDTGMTRELEVWGTAEGETLNGVIDQLSHESPNASFEEELNLANAGASAQRPSVGDYVGPIHKTVYLTDVKTRGSDRLPSGTAVRPAKVQLFLYHRLLSDMVTDNVDYTAVFERYGLNGEARFSDAFMAQIGGLHDEIFYDADSNVGEIPTETELPDLLGYRCISQIIPLLKAELRETFPRGSASISDLLAVQYRHRADGRVLGNNSFLNDPVSLDDYIKDNLRWWRGEREPEGVIIEETYKCGWCEFAETCQWRRDKEVEFLNRRKRGRTNAGHVPPAA